MKDLSNPTNTKIDDGILTMTVPFVAFEPVTPFTDIFEKTINYFNSHFTNAKDFEVDKIENTYWVIIDNEWCELGSNIIFRRKIPSNPTDVKV